MLDHSPEFIQTIQNTFGEAGKRWLESLPALLEEACSRWELTDVQPVPNLSYNFVAFARLDTESNVSRRWLAIDPKGVIGPRGYEVGPLLINPLPDFLNGSNPRAQTTRRIAILSEMLGMEQERIRAWAICHAVLSAWWSIEDNDPGWGEYSIHCAEIWMTV